MNTNTKDEIRKLRKVLVDVASEAMLKAGHEYGAGYAKEGGGHMTHAQFTHCTTVMLNATTNALISLLANNISNSVAALEALSEPGSFPTLEALIERATKDVADIAREVHETRNNGGAA